MQARMDHLVDQRFTIMAYKDLPKTHQLAIAWYMGIDGPAWEVPVSKGASLKDAVEKALPELIERHGDMPFGVVNFYVETLKSQIMRDEDIAGDHAEWKSYHDAYVASGGMPEHDTSSLWPVILSNDDEETLIDGWHRFHSYAKSGVKVIPAIFYPESRHLEPKELSLSM